MTDPDRPLSDRDYQALARFRRALRLFQRFSDDAARAAGLAPAQHQLLLAVRGHADGDPTIGDLADALQLRLHSASELVARTQAHGLVTRVPDPHDHRKVRVRLTREGEAGLAELTRRHRAELRRFRAELADVVRVLDP